MKTLRQRKSLRLKGYDYSQNGCYFITICTKNREYLFGDIVDSIMVLNDYGKTLEDEWHKSETIRTEIKSDCFCIMPNHFHAIVRISSDNTVGTYGNTSEFIPTTHNELLQQTYCHTSLQSPLRSPSKTLGAMVRAFKGMVTAHIRNMDNAPYVIWQKSYHDHIIRNEQSYQKIYEYIQNNPLQWEFDCHHPSNPKYKEWSEKNG